MKSKIKSAVMTLANALHYRKGYDRSRATKTAWAMVKQGQFYTKVAGVSFGSRQKALERLRRYAKEMVQVFLNREDNPVDKNAVGIIITVNGSKPYHLGYLPREIANIWAWLVEKGLAKAEIAQVTGGNKKNFGANLILKIA